MRKSRKEAAETRRRIVRAAADKFQRQGIGATGLDEVMGAAGLTHGGFYRHFRSKEQLVAEACAISTGEMRESMSAALAGKRGRAGLRAIAAQYFSAAHRDDPHGCALAAFGGEIARADDETRAVATGGFLELVDIVAAQLGKARPSAAKKDALAAVSMMIGALMMARIVNDPELSEAILRSAEKRLVDF